MASGGVLSAVHLLFDVRVCIREKNKLVLCSGNTYIHNAAFLIETLSSLSIAISTFRHFTVYREVTVKQDVFGLQALNAVYRSDLDSIFGKQFLFFFL